MSTIGEKCGVVAVWTSTGQAPFLARRALLSLQHRGQESAGISVYKKNKGVTSHIGMGLVPHVLRDEVIKKIGKSNLAIGQNRYSTSSKSALGNAQPVSLSNREFKISLGHNGNLYNVSLFREFAKNGVSDTVQLTSYLLARRSEYSTWHETLVETLPHIEKAGSFCLVMLTSDGEIFAVRDPRAIRPLCFGELASGWVIASESVALDILGANFVREVAGGEILRITGDGRLSSSFFGPPRRSRHCIFEGIYFSRPDSFLYGQRLRTAREKAGRALAKKLTKKGIHPEVVVPIMDSGLSAAIGVSRELGIPLEFAITTSHYIGRTFIEPEKKKRLSGVNGKHNFTPEGIQDKVVVIVDDSAVRLTTSPAIVKGLRRAGAKKIHAAFASPPVVNPCDLGIDMPTKKELPASRWLGKPLAVIENNIKKLIGAHSVTYLPIEEVAASLGGKPEDFYYTYFGGPHPIRDDSDIFAPLARKIPGLPRVAVFISGSGTNLQRIIDEVGSGRIKAGIVGVLSNNPNAFGLRRAEKHKIPATVFPSKGKLKNPRLRKEYEKQLIDYVRQTSPDAIVLAGWLIVLGDGFLKTMQEMEIPVINLHPGLLTRYNERKVMTSRGEIPVLRGMHAIEDAYKLKLPVSGVTVHQVLPGEMYDVGPIVLKEEVHRRENEKRASWEARVHATEHRILPLALVRVVQALKHGVDVSRGDFPW